MLPGTKYPCPCSGYRTLNGEPPGTFDICNICFWEDDGIQFDDPDLDEGANDVSLRQAQANFMRIGAVEEAYAHCVRPPCPTDVRDPNWMPLPQSAQK